VKRFMMTLAAAAAFLAAAPAHAQMGTGAPAATPAPQRPRIALVNIAKVLREFQKANSDGQSITKKRQEYVDRVRPLREMLATKSKAIAATVNLTEKEKMQKEAIAINRQIEDLDQEAQRVLGDMTDKTIVEVYTNLKSVINDIAVTNNLDLVMCYPDASNAEEEKKPAVAQLKLQTPALIPFYHRGMDITDVVIVTLNRRHPAPPVAAAPPMGGTGGNVVPVSGKR
jgi:Skp family chaperone for outer membrane proteins